MTIDQFRDWLSARHMSLAAFGRMAGYSKSYMSKLSTGDKPWTKRLDMMVELVELRERTNGGKHVD